MADRTRQPVISPTMWSLGLVYAALACLTVWVLGPLVWVWLSALKTRMEFVQNPFGLPRGLYWGNLVSAWTSGHFGRFSLNSIIVVVPVVAVSVTLSVLAAYGLTILKARGENQIVAYFLLGMMIPFQSIMIPLYFEIRDLRLLDSYLGVILPELAVVLPFGVFLIRGFFKDVPREMLDAARIDGCSSFQALMYVVAPLAGPAILSLAIFNFMSAWNSFLLPLLVIQSPDLRTLSLGLMYFGGGHGSDWALVSAGVTIMSLPVVLLYVVLQRRFVQGITAGAVNE